jgi:hypothetical protein
MKSRLVSPGGEVMQTGWLVLMVGKAFATVKPN